MLELEHLFLCLICGDGHEVAFSIAGGVIPAEHSARHGNVHAWYAAGRGCYRRPHVEVGVAVLEALRQQCPSQHYDF